MGRYRTWYCGICGSEADSDDNYITHCDCGIFYGQCCANYCSSCDGESCPECGEGIKFECCDAFLCDDCLSKYESNYKCPECKDENLLICPDCGKYYCSSCAESFPKNKIENLEGKKDEEE
ncbi:MAG: hypothetical protein ACTSVU_05225 [Promethearchaeota archaeon]